MVRKLGREVVQIVEIDVDVCDLVYGQAPCTAVLGTTGQRKCYNTWRTCQAREAYSDAKLTLRFASPTVSLPRGSTIFPTLTSISQRSGTVNIGGADSSLGPTGRRSTVSMTFSDHPYHDRLTDPYAQERVSGAAQLDEPGYQPAARGTFWGKLLARWPYYIGRALRIVDGYIVGGEIVSPRTRHYVISGLSGPSSDGSVTIEAQDVLNLADNDRAYAPKASRGVLAAKLDKGAATCTLSPAGIGEEYPAAGYVCIGSEVMNFDRMGDTLVLNGRALHGTVEADHDAGDTVQLSLHVTGRIDAVVRTLLCDHAGIPTMFVPDVEWDAEIGRWMPAVYIDRLIPKPELVSSHLKSLSELGLSIWWNDVAQKIGLKTVRPPDADLVRAYDDDSSLLAMDKEDLPDDRLSRVLILSVQDDVTKSATDGSNYKRVSVSGDFRPEDVREYGAERTRVIYSPWFNSGADGVLAGIGARMLKRFAQPPVRYRITVDAAHGDVALTDVASLRSRAIQEETGLSLANLAEIISISDVQPGHSIDLTLQNYSFSGRYGFITKNDRPTYSNSTDEQRQRGGYLVDPETLLFSDGSGPYAII